MCDQCHSTLSGTAIDSCNECSNCMCAQGNLTCAFCGHSTAVPLVEGSSGGDGGAL